jgi:probable F420-dependent oxidoreductase
MGYDVVPALDLPGGLSPFPALVAAADATSTIRLTTLIINPSFWHPELLFREIATVDEFSGGRLEIGLGAGNVQAGSWDGPLLVPEPVARTARLRHTINVLKDAMASNDRTPAIVQKPRPPILIAGASDGMVRLAAKEADTFQVSGPFPRPKTPEGVPPLVTAADFDSRVSLLHEAAGARADEIEISVGADLVLTEDREATATKLHETHSYLTVADILDSPKLMIGTEDEVAEQLLRNRERFGLSYYAINHPKEFAPILARLKGMTERQAVHAGGAAQLREEI